MYLSLDSSGTCVHMYMVIKTILIARSAYDSTCSKLKCRVISPFKISLPYFPDYKPRLFFKNFKVEAYIVVQLICGRFQKTTHYTLHATACLDQHLITISSPTVLHNHWLSLQPCGHPSPALCVSLSLSVYAWCLIPMAVNCTVVRGSCLLHAPAEHGKTPAWSPLLSTQLWPPGGSSDIDQWGLMHHDGLWPTHVTQLTHFLGHTPDVSAWLGIKLLHHRRLFPTLLSLRVEFSGPRRSCLAALLPIFSSRVCIQGHSYMQGNNRRWCD